jgi:hypothetical protein
MLRGLGEFQRLSVLSGEKLNHGLSGNTTPVLQPKASHYIQVTELSQFLITEVSGEPAVLIFRGD